MESEETKEFKENIKKFKLFFDRNSLFLILTFTIVGVSLGLWLAWRIYQNYRYMRFGDIYFERTSNIQDLGNVLSGTVGIIFTLVGIVLLAFTLIQTQRELNETQSILKNQLVETSFFNVLKNHQDVILGRNAAEFERTIKGVNEGLSTYTKSLVTRNFRPPISTKLTPEVFYNTYPILQKIGKSIVHIMSLIENGVAQSNKEFYHTTFYYNLSEAEKFLLGMIIENKLIAFTYETPKQYSDHYNFTSPYKTKERSGYFPFVDLHNLRENHFFFPEYYDNEMLALQGLELKFKLNYNDVELRLKSVEYILRENETDEAKFKLFNYHANQEGTATLGPIFKDIDFLNLLRNSHRFYCELFFVFEYREVVYYISTKLQFISIVISRTDTTAIQMNISHQFDKFEVNRLNYLRVVEITA